MEAIILIGIQGSGKTTFCERFFDTHVRISLDLVKTRNRERALLATCVRTGQKFVIDNTNLTVAERAVYVIAAKRAGFRVKAYFFEPSLRLALKRNAQRSGRAAIPVAGVIATLKRLQRPDLSEGFDDLYTVSFDNGQLVSTDVAQEIPDPLGREITTV
jgi:predicted kinase